MPKEFQTGATLMLSKQIFGSHEPNQCEALLFLAHRAAFLPAVSGMVGKGLERETLCPFPRLRRFGTHSETGSKFLLLFSIKSKEGILCFAEKVPNGRTTNLVQEIFCANALYICRFRLVGKGLERETLCPFPRLRRFGTHSETGSKFLLLFSIKSKEERLCFAERVLNWRNTHVAQEKLCANAPF